jgi:GTP-binding protein
MVATHDLGTLIDFTHQKRFDAEAGAKGGSSNCTGRSGRDTIIRVPTGTLVLDAATGERLADLTLHGQKWVAAVGGRGGRGNQHFKSSTRQAPELAERGLPGQEKRLKLELKLLADVGLVGFPNAGKSTLISRISAAHPKIADYPFTTLEPSLGVAQLDGFQSFVVADIPGLIEGAHLGHGLGIQFLRHVERTRLLAHLVDVSEATGRDPVHDFDVVMGELASFSEELARKPMMVVATKIDAAQDPARVTALREMAKAKGLAFLEISSVTGKGVEELKRAIAERVFAERMGAGDQGPGAGD